MQYSLLSLAFAALAVANPMPQGVTSAMAPSSTAPAGCSPDFSGSFEIEVVNVTTSSKRDLQKRAALVVTLANGILTDDQGRTGYIAANYQFQFDKPAQTGAIYTAGWSVCSNGSLALGGSAIFYECLSGTFYNLYDESIGGQCAPIYIDVIPANAAAPASVISDGQVTAQPVTQITDGQPQASTGVVTQISDGQIQQPTGNPVTQISDGQIQGPTGTARPITQISDGQIQGPTGNPVTQISDGQIQGPTGNPVTQISDGQIQGPTGAPVTQISDGQIQGPTGAPQVTPIAPITIISDGQPQAPVSTGTGTGRATASRNLTTPSTPSTSPITPAGASPNAATSLSTLGSGIFALAAMVLGVALL